MNKLFNILGHEMLLQRIGQIVQRDKIATAYLFASSTNTVGDAVAMNFAALLHCQNKNACGECSDCKKIQQLQHPDVQLIFALPSKSSNNDSNPLKGFARQEIEQIQRLIANKAKNPYLPMIYPDGNIIRINSIREMKRLLSLEANEGGRKTTILFDAEKLSEAAANSLLKILEEPPPRTTIILISSNSDSLLPTIQSRCQEIIVSSISANAMLEYLSAQFPKKTNLRSIANIANGDVNWAMSLAQSDTDDIAQIIINFLHLVENGSAENIVSEGEKRGRMAKENINQFRDEIRILQWFFRDALLLRNMSELKMLKLVDHRNLAKSLNEKYPHVALEKIIGLLENYGDLAPKNIYITPLFIHLILTVKEMSKKIK